MKIQCKYQCNNCKIQPVPREVNAAKFVREFRAATLECNAGQSEVELS